ncbi:MAG: translational GTPase TypA [Planctomycetaceae bacterium]|nr:translational GTPase TypA [Planctomycetaceae bacterium]
MSTADLPARPAPASVGARRRDDVRNLAIIAHVDHGKTTLVDVLLKESGEFRASELTETCILDSNDLERERGITILAKNVAMHYKGVKINLIDTPGHADFGGEVERVLRMADGALVLVDAAEGPMPQTRFVLSKAIEFGLKPIVVINKIDRNDARCNEVLNEVFELFLELGADDELADFPYIFAAGRQGYATPDFNVPGDSIRPLLDLVLEHVPGPIVDETAPLQMLVTTLDWSEFVGRIAIGRIVSGTVKKGQRVMLMQKDDKQKAAKVTAIQVFEKLARVEVQEAGAGDVVALVGLEDVEIGDTISDFDNPQRMERVQVDQPTLEMTFSVNSSPFAGKSGKFLTTRHIRDRLMRELERNVALRVRQIENSDSYAVAGRGLLHLSVLIETMRREGYELSIGKPKVINKEIDGVLHEPFESLVVEVPPEKLGKVMELVGARRGQMVEMTHRGNYSYVVFSIPARGLIGLRTRILNATQGEGIMHHRFEGYKPLEGDVPSRQNGVLVSMVSGKAFAFGLDGLQDRSDLFIAPGAEIYEGMIVGENSRDNDMTVNPCREKKLTNMRASGTDDNVILKPPRQITLETALEYIEDDELVEVTPDAIRLRKILLTENDRKRASRAAK